MPELPSPLHSFEHDRRPLVSCPDALEGMLLDVLSLGSLGMLCLLAAIRELLPYGGVAKAITLKLSPELVNLLASYFLPHKPANLVHCKRHLPGSQNFQNSPCTPPETFRGLGFGGGKGFRASGSSP